MPTTGTAAGLPLQGRASVVLLAAAHPATFPRITANTISHRAPRWTAHIRRRSRLKHSWGWEPPHKQQPWELQRQAR